MDLYREDILEHYKHPNNFGELADADATIKSLNPQCGDEMIMQVRIEKGKVRDIRFHGSSCAISRAGASMLTEEIKGKTLEEIQAMTDQAHLERFGKDLAPGRVKCGLLSLETVRQAIRKAADKEHE
jgi:nitrogen fixation NifU-like protein